MSTFSFFLLVILLAAGVTKDIRAKQARQYCLDKQINGGIPEYNLGSVILAGLGAIISLISGILSNSTGVIVGIIISVIVTIPYLLGANKDVRLLKKANWGIIDIIPFSPIWVWGRIVLLGIGKWGHALFVITLIGIPLYRMVEEVGYNMDNLIRQIELRQEYERQIKEANRNEILKNL